MTTINLFSKTSTVLHFVGTYAIAMTMLSFGSSLMTAAITALALGFIWECLDYLNCEYGWNWPVLDPKGADFLDFMADVGGVLLVLLIGWI